MTKSESVTVTVGSENPQKEKEEEFQLETRKAARRLIKAREWLEAATGLIGVGGLRRDVDHIFKLQAAEDEAGIRALTGKSLSGNGSPSSLSGQDMGHLFCGEHISVGNQLGSNDSRKPSGIGKLLGAALGGGALTLAGGYLLDKLTEDPQQPPPVVVPDDTDTVNTIIFE